MLLSGINHVAILTNDTERLHAFYREVFDATILRDGPEPSAGPEPSDTAESSGSAEPSGTEEPSNSTAPSPVRMSVIHVGPFSELNVFQVEGNTEADRQTPMFGRGRIDHLALHAESLEAFETIRSRLMERGAADDFVTDFGSILSVFFRDPDGLECEVCVPNPDARPGVSNPPGTRAARFA